MMDRHKAVWGSLPGLLCLIPILLHTDRTGPSLLTEFYELHYIYWPLLSLEEYVIRYPPLTLGRVLLPLVQMQYGGTKHSQLSFLFCFLRWSQDGSRKNRQAGPGVFPLTGLSISGFKSRTSSLVVRRSLNPKS
jgi:hypothetical protein